jgi:NAD(P)-dependent dehydrogenase (short-subunit alcohol dehydrogenase family)
MQTEPRLNGRAGLVTGAARGIGRAVALMLAEGGLDVVVCDVSGEEAQEVARAVRDLGREALVHELDVSDRGGVDAMIAATVARFGRLDVVVTSHAHSVREPILEAGWEGFRRTIEVMQLGVVHVAQLAAQQMARQAPIGESRGKIVLIGSVRAFLPIAGSPAYNMAKAATRHFARTIAAELAPHHINVSEDASADAGSLRHRPPPGRSRSDRARCERSRPGRGAPRRRPASPPGSRSS